MAQERSYAVTAATLLLAGLLTGGCVAGGVIDKGGLVDGTSLAPQASLMRGADYWILCPDHSQEAAVRLAEIGEPPIRRIEPIDYRGGCRVRGESSQLFLFNFMPVTPRLDPQLALFTAVQSLEGDTLIGLRFWHETHYYSLLGRVSLFVVEGEVIRFKPRESKPKESAPADRRRR